MPALSADTNPLRFLAPLSAVVLALLVLLAAPGAASAFTATSGGAKIVYQPLTAPKGIFAGKASVLNGHLDGHSGSVSLTARLGKRGAYMPIGTAKADADGDFKFKWKAPKSGLWTVRIAPQGSTLSAASTTNGSLVVYRRQKATWYGPGFYGSRTACGTKLTKKTLGVAHRTLPCGTKVEFFLRGKRLKLPVIDRGPFVRGVVWDLTLTAMKRLGSRSTEVLGALPVS